MQSVTNMKSGIAVIGTIIVDKINEITSYPNQGELCQINSIKTSVGGCVPNDALNLKSIDPSLSVYAVGRIGRDEEGEFALNTLKNKGVNVDGVVFGNDKTNFTEVMSIPGGQRTFFSYAGVGKEFCFEDVDFSALPVKMLHLGYFLLLKKVDEGDGEKILKKAKELGISTSIDLVSENSNRYSLVIPCLKYVDNLIINEIEASKLTGIEISNSSLKRMANKLKEFGVSDRVIIHTPDISVCLSNSGYIELPSYELPNGFIKGATGAGDAFCSGALIGIYRNYSDVEILKLASSCAVASLSNIDAVSGVKTEEEILELCKNFKRKELCL